MTDAQRQNVAWFQDIYINFASVQFTPNGNTCNGSDKSSCYGAKVIWTSSVITGNAYRPCGIPQLPANDTAPPNGTTLPRSIFGAGSIIVVDVVFTFRPTFGQRFMPPTTISRSVYVHTRYATLIYYTPSNDGTRCS